MVGGRAGPVTWKRQSSDPSGSTAGWAGTWTTNASIAGLDWTFTSTNTPAGRFTLEGSSEDAGSIEARGGRLRTVSKKGGASVEGPTSSPERTASTTVLRGQRCGPVRRADAPPPARFAFVRTVPCARRAAGYLPKASRTNDPGTIGGRGRGSPAVGGGGAPKSAATTKIFFVFSSRAIVRALFWVETV